MRRFALGLTFALAALAVLALVRSARRDRLPAEIRIDDRIVDLTATFARETVEAEASADPVRRGEIRPGSRLRAEGERPGLVAPPRSRLHFRLDLPAGAALRFAVGVQGSGKRDPEQAGVRFSLLVNGTERWARVVNPAAHRHDRRWFDERVDLGLATGGPVDLVLATDAETPGRPLSGTPAWGDARVVRETRRSRQPAAPATPNVIVVLVDTLRADRLGCYGARPSPSPTLDHLAAQGLLFEQVIAQSSWTLPSVGSLFTGLYPRSHGALGEPSDADADASWGFLADDVVTWAELALRAGITTYGVSANPLVSRASNLAQGFESFVELGWDPEARNWPAAAEVNRAFLAWLRANRGYRFLGYLHYMEPHDPYTPPAALRPSHAEGIPAAIRAGWVRDDATRVNWHAAPPLPAPQVDHLRRLYEGEIQGWDEQLGALLDGLDELGLRDDTVLVVTSDHGEEFQEHGRLVHQTQLYEESIHVPLVLVGPGITPGRRADPVQGVDLLPTLAGLLGFDPPPGLPGRSLLATPMPRPALTETANGIAPDGARIELIALRTERWKLIHAPALGRYELYDLAGDPGEHDDRHATAPEAAELIASLAALQQAAPVAPRPLARDPALHEKLRALGYVE